MLPADNTILSMGLIWRLPVNSREHYCGDHNPLENYFPTLWFMNNRGEATRKE
jgi:hypothetical protein